MKSLKDSTGKFASTNANMVQPLETIKNKMAEEKSGKSKPFHSMVLESKKFMWNLYRDGGIGKWIDVFSFIESGDANYSGLAKIYELSTIQSYELDDMINDFLYGEYETNKPNEGEMKGKKSKRKMYRNIVVGGAGPIGLYIALQLFMAGLKVTVANARSEHYARNQDVRLDTHWTVQLRLFLGTQYDILFHGDQALGAFYEKGHYVRINTKILEQTLKERLAALANYVDNKSKENDILRLIYEANVTEIQFPMNSASRFYAILESKPTDESTAMSQKMLKHSDQDGTTKAKLQKKTTTIIDYIRKDDNRIVKADEELIIYDRRMISPKQYAMYELEGKVLDYTLKKLPFDLYVCSGGAHDKIRDKYRIPCNVTLVPIPEEIGVKGVSVTMKEMETFLRKQNFDQLLANSSFLPATLKKKFSNFIELMLYGLVEESGKDKKGETVYNMLGGQLLRGKTPLKDSSIKLGIHENQLAIGFFFLLLRHGVTAAIMLEGDALVNSHFFTGTGISTSRISAEKSVNALKEYNSKGKDLMGTLTEVKNIAIERALRLGQRFLQTQPNKDKIAKKAVIDAIESIEKPGAIGPYRYAIKGKDFYVKVPKFRVETGGKIIEGVITEKGGIDINGTTYYTFIQAVVGESSKK
ncbi:hypothetical protein DdX_18181 [Ditylenchus destructor]|uniref:Uncharacterized protein n=1 Tax=Ditylenchus destructor TaxID=166010 RepID=A0AAD4MPZ5_9BILA|nr:hypothetical protein DdX_18181 [Ditylenchus destructor]